MQARAYAGAIKVELDSTREALHKAREAALDTRAGAMAGQRGMLEARASGLERVSESRVRGAGVRCALAVWTRV